MAVSVVVAVKDLAVGAFSRPVFVPSVGVAMRSFRDEVMRQAKPGENQMFDHPEDFELWLLAEFDEDTGVFTSKMDGQLSRIMRGKDVKEMSNG